MAAQVITFSPPSTPSTTFTVGSTSTPSYSAVTQMQPGRGGNAPRSAYNPQSNAGYRPGAAVPSYAFTATPQLNQQQSNPLRQHPSGQQQQQQQHHDQRSVSASNGTQRPMLALDLNGMSGNNPSKPSPIRYKQQGQRQGSGPSTPTLGSMGPSGSGMAAVGHLYQHSTQSLSSPSLMSGSGRTTSTDDFNVHKQTNPEQAKRYRRRSINSIGGDDQSAGPRAAPAATAQMPRSYAAVASASYVPDRQDPRFAAPQQYSMRPSSAHGRNNSNESSSSSVRSSSRPRSARREPALTSNSNSSSHPSTSQHAGQSSAAANNANKSSSIASRGAADASKRHTNPSPLSQPMTMGPDSPSSPTSAANNVAAASSASESPAAQHLAALNKREEQKKGAKPSRLRRAFSFGSAAELRKASAANNLVNNNNNNINSSVNSNAVNGNGNINSNNVDANNERARLQKPQYRTEEEAREAAIIQQQEAAGLGASIYSGQGNFFTGSTDNLSMSSTASSASMMLRKMGKGMKKGTKSFVGLFRPKSVIGVPAADAAVPEPSMAEVSMVTVEAERENVNVNIDPHDRAGGGTGFPKLERNSVDVARTSFSEGTTAADALNGRPRRSIVGGERERAEVLAAVKKGILKRSGTDSAASSPSTRPSDLKPASEYVLPQLPRFSDSPVSSAPSTPRDDTTPRGSHRRTDSVSIEGDDYFINARMAAADGEGRSLPGTPRSGTRGITFSPKIQFHDTWPSGEYDRRGDIATCNRLTPTLAQQIKEELNSFKMEMEVHESSKIYTHFF